MRASLDLAMGVDAGVEGGFETEPRTELVSGQILEIGFQDGVAAVVLGSLGKESQVGFQKAALGEVLGCGDNAKNQHRQEGLCHVHRRSASMVKSSGFTGRLYWSFSSFITVRLFRPAS